MTIHEIETSNKYYYHHSACRTGYAYRHENDSRNIIPYHGRFGTGYIIKYPIYRSTRFCTYCYYILKEGNEN